MARRSLARVDLAELADLVEENCPPPRGDEQPRVVAVGAGEGAADMAEELVLQQVVGNRRAVDCEEHRVRVGTAGVQGPRHQLLAGARLAGDEHRAPGRADLAYQGLHGLHRRAPADQRLQVLVGVELPAAKPGSRASSRRYFMSRSILASSSSNITGFIR